MTDTPKLLPCPFCGGEAELVDPANGSRPYIMCVANYCTAPQKDAVTAIAAWNRRHDAAVSAARKEGMLDMITTRLQHLIAWLEADDDNIYHLPVDDVQALRNWVNKKPPAETTP